MNLTFFKCLVQNRAVNWFLCEPAPSYSVSQFILWWESRRIPYNLLLCIYLWPCALLFELALERYPIYIEAGREGEVAIGFVVGFVILANILYAVTWIISVCLRQTLGPARCRYFSKSLIGFIFCTFFVVPFLAYYYARWVNYVAHCNSP